MTADERIQGDERPFDPVRLLIEEITSGKGPEVVAVESDVLRHLNRRQAGPGKDARVRRSLDIARKVGKKELGDLLYELTRVCLLANTSYEYAQNARTYVDPRPAPDLRGDIDAMNRRLRGDAALPASVPRAKPLDAQALEAAQACIDCSEELVGPGLGSTFLLAHVRTRSDQGGEALEVLNRLSASSNTTPWMQHVYTFRTALLLRLGRLQDCVRAVHEVMGRFPHNSSLLLNLATAHGLLGQVDAWEDAAVRFAKSPDKTNSPGHLEQLLAREARVIAPLIRKTPTEVMASYGLRFGSRPS